MPTHYQGSAQEKLALNAFIKLTRATDSLLSRLARAGTTRGLSSTQFGVLEVLYHLGPMCQSELGSKLLKSGGNITLVIDNLEKRGLVVRERHPEDRRMFRIHLTQTGKSTIEKILPGHIGAITAEMSVLTPEEQDLLGKLCRKLGVQENSTD